MQSASKATDSAAGSPASNVEITSLYKIFGDRPATVMPLVEDGMGKQELLASHNHVLALRDINLRIDQRSVQVVMGLSGSGKSTLVRHINRLIEPTRGAIQVGHDNVLAFSDRELQQFRRRKISMVFQRFALFPHKTVMDNVAYGLGMQGVPHAERSDRAARWVERVGLQGYEASLPGRLSGGMQQRVGLARALATDADVLLMDEPFSALDPLIRTDMRALLLDLQRELCKTIVFVTHDLEEAFEVGDRIAILRDGEIVQNGTSQEIVLEPVNDYIAEFTRDIDRGRVLRIGSIMEPVRKHLEGPPDVSPDMLLDEALPLVMTAPRKEVPVVAREGVIVGSVSVAGMMRALGAGRGDEGAPPPRGR